MPIEEELVLLQVVVRDQLEDLQVVLHPAQHNAQYTDCICTGNCSAYLARRPSLELGNCSSSRQVTCS